MSVEQRSQERVRAFGAIYYSGVFRKYGFQKRVRQYGGHVVDICTSGICISSPWKFEPGDMVTFQLDERCEGVYTGFVRRCVEQSDGNYHIGLEVPFRNDINTH